MGYYINPPHHLTKDEFLNAYGVEIPIGTKLNEVPAGMLPVALINNVAFKAIWILYSEEEYEELRRSGMRRVEKMYALLVEDIAKASPEFSRYLELLREKK